MKRLAYLFAGAALIMSFGYREVSAVSKVSGKALSIRDQSVATTPSFDVGEISRLAIQVNYSSSTLANVSFTDGSKSSIQVTVTSAAYVFNSTPTLVINGVILSYTPVQTATGTAQAIANAINANSSLNTIIVSTWASPSLGIVSATATVTGLNAYSVTTSSWAALTPSNFAFTGGVASDVTSASDLVTKTNSYAVGQGVSLSTTTNVALPGLTWGVTYYVIPVITGSTFKLATSRANASAGTAIDISSSSTGGGAFVLSASSTTTGSSFVMQQSIDNVNWVVATSTGSVLPTVTVGPPSGIGTVDFDLGFYNYRYLRFNFTPANAGGLDIDVWFQGKNDQ